MAKKTVRPTRNICREKAAQRRENSRFRSRSQLCRYGRLHTTLTGHLREVDYQLDLPFGTAARFVLALGIYELDRILYKPIKMDGDMQREVEQLEAEVQFLEEERQRVEAREKEAADNPIAEARRAPGRPKNPPPPPYDPLGNFTSRRGGKL